MSKQFEAVNRKIHALVQQSKDLRIAAEKEDRELTEEELAVVEKCVAEVRELSAEATKLKDQAATFAELDQAGVDATASQGRVVKAQPGPIDQGLTGTSNDGKTYVLGVEQKRQGFGSLGEQLAAVIHAGQVAAGAAAGSIDQRLNIQAATGLSEGVLSEGGALVQTDFATELLRRTYQTALVASRCRKIPISANANGLKMNAIAETSRATGSRWGGIQAYWAAEAGVKTASKPEFRQMELDLKKLIGLCYATDELLQDTTALESIISMAFAEEFGWMVDDAVVNGTGAGMPLGIMPSPCLVSVAAENGQANATIVAENVENMYSRLWAPSIPNAAWLINQNCWPQIFQLSHAVGTGGVPMFIPAGGLTGSPNGTLLGRPIIPIEQCQTLGTTGDIILGDFGQYLLIDKGGIQSASSIHVRFVYDESVFRFVYRVDGQPTWNSALTPANSTATLSPFVVLESRP